ncbi:LysR family transcriptional regulator [Clostridium sp. UBA5712]|uniref:LysR family transcriptional regulator n=1 Tax=Clostridium sp. UBA5712 TaxID=1946368 RepID=UPI003217F1E0
MNLRQMYIFKEVCEELSFTKTAKKLYMTQPAISHVISDLEAEIGGKLFERIGRKIHLTGTGEILLHKVVRIIELHEELENGFKYQEELVTIRIGSSITIANFWLQEWIKEWRRKYGRTPLKIQVDSATNIEEKLLSNEIDIALMEGAIHNKQLISHEVSSYEMSVICSSNHDFVKNGRLEIAAEEFAAQPLLLREKGSAIRDTLDSALLLKHIYVDPMMTSVNSQALIQAVKYDFGISVIPDLLVMQQVKEGDIAKLSIKDIRLFNYNSICYHRDKYLSKPMQWFIDCCIRIK